MNNYIIAYLLLALVHWPIFTGFHFALLQRKYPRLAEEEWREDLGNSILLSLMLVLLWPVGWVLVACSLEFFKYGWTLNPKSLTGKWHVN